MYSDTKLFFFQFLVLAQLFLNALAQSAFTSLWDRCWLLVVKKIPLVLSDMGVVKTSKVAFQLFVLHSLFTAGEVITHITALVQINTQTSLQRMLRGAYRSGEIRLRQYV